MTLMIKKRKSIIAAMAVAVCLTVAALFIYQQQKDRPLTVLGIHDHVVFYQTTTQDLKAWYGEPYKVITGDENIEETESLVWDDETFEDYLPADYYETMRHAEKPSRLKGSISMYEYASGESLGWNNVYFYVQDNLVVDMVFGRGNDSIRDSESSDGVTEYKKAQRDRASHYAKVRQDNAAVFAKEQEAKPVQNIEVGQVYEIKDELGFYTYFKILDKDQVVWIETDSREWASFYKGKIRDFRDKHQYEYQVKSYQVAEGGFGFEAEEGTSVEKNGDKVEVSKEEYADLTLNFYGKYYISNGDYFNDWLEFVEKSEKSIPESEEDFVKKYKHLFSQ